jgi:hypothetical protein
VSEGTCSEHAIYHSSQALPDDELSTPSDPELAPAAERLKAGALVVLFRKAYEGTWDIDRRGDRMVKSCMVLPGKREVRS